MLLFLCCHFFFPLYVLFISFLLVFFYFLLFWVSYFLLSNPWFSSVSNFLRLLMSSFYLHVPSLPHLSYLGVQNIINKMCNTLTKAQYAVLHVKRYMYNGILLDLHVCFAVPKMAVCVISYPWKNIRHSVRLNNIIQDSWNNSEL